MDAIKQYNQRLKRFSPPPIIYGLGTPVDITPDKPVPHILQDAGFTYAGSCNCDGTTNYKYSKDNYIVYFLPKRKRFHIKLINNYIIKHEPIHNLCPKLESLGLSASKPSSQVAG